MNNETILSYVNSKDIRNHLRTIGYQFTSLEAAWLICHCNILTLAQQHEAWSDIISTMPDMPIDRLEEKSLHDFLKQYIEFEKRGIEKFKLADGSVYCYTVNTKNRNHSDYIKWDRWGDNFSLYENCLNAAKTYVAEHDEKSEILSITIKKDKIDPVCSQETHCTLNRNFELLSLVRGLGDVPIEFSTSYYNFPFLEFPFPAPFTKGDILYDIYYPFDEPWGGPMVMEDIGPHPFAENVCPEDRSDMIISGYFQNYGKGSIYKGITWNYMNFEYYPVEKLEGKYRVLLAISNLLKGKIDIGLCLNTYHQIMLEESAKTHMPREYIKDAMAPAGVINESD